MGGERKGGTATRRGGTPYIPPARAGRELFRHVTCARWRPTQGATTRTTRDPGRGRLTFRNQPAKGLFRRVAMILHNSHGSSLTRPPRKLETRTSAAHETRQHPRKSSQKLSEISPKSWSQRYGCSHHISIGSVQTRDVATSFAEVPLNSGRNSHISVVSGAEFDIAASPRGLHVRTLGPRVAAGHSK